VGSCVTTTAMNCSIKSKCGINVQVPVENLELDLKTLTLPMGTALACILDLLHYTTHEGSSVCLSVDLHVLD